MKVKIYLKKKTKLSETPVKKTLTPYLKQIEYTHNIREADVEIDCEFINKDTIYFHKRDIVEKVEKAIALKSKSVSHLR